MAGTWKDYALSGYLAPDGTYYECEYQEHGTLAVELVEKYGLKIRRPDTNRFADFIKFGCYPWVDNKQGNDGCHVFMIHDMASPPTEEQVEWLVANWSRMTKNQERSVLQGLDYFDMLTPELEARIERVEVS